LSQKKQKYFGGVDGTVKKPIWGWGVNLTIVD